jgi:hypothetical protein
MSGFAKQYDGDSDSRLQLSARRAIIKRKFLPDKAMDRHRLL